MVDPFYTTASGGFYGLLEQWQNFGVFTVLLPLILIFSVVFAILEKINIFKNKGVHLIVALSIGFFTISNPYVSAFFLPLFSNLALGIGIMIVLIILLGVAVKIDDKKNFIWVFGLPAIIIFIVVLARTNMLRYMFGDNIDKWLSLNSSWVVLLVFVLLMVIAVVFGAQDEQGKTLLEKVFLKK